MVVIKRNGTIIGKSGKVLKPQFRGGYARVRLETDGNYKSVHLLVANKYLPKIKGKRFINHKDGIKSNNNVNNLEWCNRSENMKHAYQLGLKSAKGSDNSFAKVTEVIVRDIRLKHKRGETIKSIADNRGLSYSCVSHIISRRTWKHI